MLLLLAWWLVLSLCTLPASPHECRGGANEGRWSFVYDDGLQSRCPAWNEQARQAPSRLVAKMGGSVSRGARSREEGPEARSRGGGYVLASFPVYPSVCRHARFVELRRRPSCVLWDCCAAYAARGHQ